MTDDGHIKGNRVICEKGCIAQRKTTKIARNFTAIGITNLLGKPICCIVIIEGK